MQIFHNFANKIKIIHISSIYPPTQLINITSTSPIQVFDEISQGQGRQGILEFPKQIATIIRNTISDQVDRVFPTSTKTPEPVTPSPRTSRSTTEKIIPEAQTFPPITITSVEEDNGQINTVEKVTSSPSPSRSPIQQLEPIDEPFRPSVPLNPTDIEDYVYLLGVPTTTQQSVIVTSDPEEQQFVLVTEVVEGGQTSTDESGNVIVDVDSTDVSTTEQEVEVEGDETSTADPEGDATTQVDADADADGDAKIEKDY